MLLLADETNPLRLVAPFFIGVILNYLLWGVQIVQSYQYYKSYRSSDKAWVKVSVYTLVIVEAFQSICTAQSAWDILVGNWGSRDVVLNRFIGWGLAMIPFLDAFTAFIVQSFYVQKIWTLYDPPYRYMSTFMIVSFSCQQLIAGLGSTILSFKLRVTLDSFYLIRTWVAIWLATSSIADIVITGLIALRLSKCKTGYKETDDIVSRLILVTVETGFSTSVVQILDLVFGLLWPFKTYKVTLSYIVPKVYSNSMLAVLNSRNPRRMRRTENTGQFSSIVIFNTQTTQTTGISSSECTDQ